jgi:PAS domain S-box-containing protein
VTTTDEDDVIAPGARLSSSAPSGFITRDSRGRLVLDAQGAPPGSVSTFPWLSTEAANGSLWRAVSCGVVIHDADGAIADANDAATLLFARPLIELAGRHLGAPPLACVDERGTDMELSACLIHRALTTGETQRDVILGIRLPDGERRWLQADATPVFDADGPVAHVVTTFVDITSRKEHADAAIDALATGVAHDINNPLSFVMTNLDFLSHELAPAAGSEVRAALDEARVGVQRVAAIVRDLKALGLGSAKVETSPSSKTDGVTPALRLRMFVLDDEAVLTRALQRAIGREHDVVTSNDAVHAVASLTSADFLERFDVVLCDVMMPGLTGIEVYEQVVAKHPAHAKKFIFMSGGAFTPRARDFLSQIPNARLEKPFEIAQLRALLTARFTGR